ARRQEKRRQTEKPRSFVVAHARQEMQTVSNALTKPADVPLVIRLFGSLEARLNGQPLRSFRTRKDQWMLALLALHHDRPIARSVLAGMLWPDSGESQALSYLRKSLADLRAALGAQAIWLVTTPRTVQLDMSEAWADVTAFDMALQ